MTIHALWCWGTWLVLNLTKKPSWIKFFSALIYQVIFRMIEKARNLCDYGNMSGQ